MSLPTMAPGYTAATTIEWSRAIDAGPYSTLSTGERITFDNPDWLVTLSAAAVVTERVRLFANLVVLPAHPVAVVAKQLATLDQLSGGRLTVGVGVGGRGHDFRAAERPTAGRHATLDTQVAELRRLWAGEPPFPRADPVGPAPVQGADLPILAGAMGPKAMARAARWADGVSGFSISGTVDEMAANFRLAEQAWADAGRTDRPPPGQRLLLRARRRRRPGGRHPRGVRPPLPDHLRRRDRGDDGRHLPRRLRRHVVGRPRRRRRSRL